MTLKTGRNIRKQNIRHADEGRTFKGLLRDERGFTLPELLAAVAIMSIILGVVAGGASSFIRVYRSIRLRADAQTLMSTSVMAISKEMYTAHDVQTDDSLGTGSGIVTSFVSDDIGTVTYSAGKTAADEDGKQYDCILMNGNNIVADKTQTLGLGVELKKNGAGNLAEPVYHKDTNTFVFTVRVFSDDDVINETQSVTIHSIDSYPDETEAAP